MLHQPISQIPNAGAIDDQASEVDDHAMDVLQYGTALLAIVVAVILAAFH
jgi:hypothetical protein